MTLIPDHFGASYITQITAGPVTVPYDITIPTGQRWWIHSLAFRYTTSGIAINRWITIFVPGPNQWHYFQEAPFAQSQNKNYCYTFSVHTHRQLDQSFPAGTTAHQSGPLHPALYLRSPQTLRIHVHQSQFGDLLYEVEISYDRFITM